MSFSRSAGCAVLILAALVLAACGDSSDTAATTAPKGQGSKDSVFKAGTLYLVIDFERREFNLLQGSLPLWTLSFVTEDTADVADWVEEFQDHAKETARPLTENLLLRYKSQLSDSVMAIVAEASGFDAHLLERRIPARFILRWDDAALDIESPVKGSGSVGEIWQDARSTAFRLFGEEQLSVRVDSLGALTLQRVAKPPILTVVRPPRKR